MKFLVHLALLVVFAALAGAAWVAHRPAATPPPGEPAKRQRDVLDELKQAAIKRSAVFEISEPELNQHLARVLEARARPPLERWTQFRRLAVSLRPEELEATLVWDIAGAERTVSLRFQAARQDSAFEVQLVGGSYGRLEVPRGLLRPLQPLLRQLGSVFAEEIGALFQMNQVRVAQGRLVLDPRFP